MRLLREGAPRRINNPHLKTPPPEAVGVTAEPITLARKTRSAVQNGTGCPTKAVQICSRRVLVIQGTRVRAVAASSGPFGNPDKRREQGHGPW